MVKFVASVSEDYVRRLVVNQSVNDDFEKLFDVVMLVRGNGDVVNVNTGNNQLRSNYESVGKVSAVVAGILRYLGSALGLGDVVVAEVNFSNGAYVAVIGSNIIKVGISFSNLK